MNLINNYSDLVAFLGANVGTIVPFENLAQFTEAFNSTFIQGSNALKLLPEEMGQIIEFIPNLTGGTDAGAVINDVVQNPATGAVTSTVAGGLLACPATQVVAGVMLMMGVKFATEAAKEEVTNRCIRYLENDAGATQEQIDKLMYPVFINPYVPVIEEPETRVWSTALSLKIVNKINEFLNHDDAFTETEIVEYDYPTEQGNYTLNGIPCNYINIRNAINACIYNWSVYGGQVNSDNPFQSAWYNPSYMYGCATGIYQIMNLIDTTDYDTFNIEVHSYCQSSRWRYNITLTLFTRNEIVNLDVDALNALSLRGYSTLRSTMTNTERPMKCIVFENVVDSNGATSSSNVFDVDMYSSGQFIGTLKGVFGNEGVYKMTSVNSAIEAQNEDYELVEGYEHPIDGITLNDIFPSLSTFITHGLINGIENVNEYVRLNPKLFYDYNNLTETIGDISQDTLAIGDILPDVVPAIEALPAPNILEVANPVTQPNPNADPDLPTSNPTVTTTGGTPVIALPTLGSGGKMFTVYNPTQEELDDIGGKLWSTSIWDVIKSWFQSPLECIIGLSVIYINPTISSTKHDVYFGSLDSDVNSYVVTNQFSSLDCGTCAIPETFGNATDYKPYTSVSIFLPFIGFRDLDIDDVMGSTLHVKYKIDVFTGSCLATIDVTRNGITQTLYQFAGDCSFDLPVTARDRTNLLKAIPAVVGASAVGGAVGTIAGITGIANGLRENVRRTGSFSGSTGAMGGKKPFVVINRTEPYDANNYNNLYGFPSNKRVTLGSMVGFTKVKDVHVEGIACTENEKLLIESALKEGVML